ncbi:MAG: Asp-tRNA(Asn)/Glu-tRNA(Gln) amidotransferase subunit GatC [Bacillota bacterium]
MSNIYQQMDELSLAARLELSPEEKEYFAVKLEDLLGQIKTIYQLDLKDVEATVHLLTSSNVFREDEKRPGLDRETALAGAPEQKDGCFRVPRII